MESWKWFVVGLGGIGVFFFSDEMILQALGFGFYLIAISRSPLIREIFKDG